MIDVEYSTKPITVATMLYASRAGHGDIEAMIALIAERTNLTPDKILALDMEDLAIVTSKIVETVVQSDALAKLGKQLGDMS